jgi:hypothetical protein
MRTRISLAVLFGCLALAALPGSALASTITPEGPFTAVAGKTTFSIPGAQYPGSATKGISISCTSSALHGTVKNVSSPPNANPITPGAPTYSGCTSTSPFNTASIVAPAPANMVIAETATLITGLKMTVKVGGCTMEFSGKEYAYYPKAGPVTRIPFENAYNNSVMTMTKPPVGLVCEVTFGSQQTMTSTATYGLNPGLTVTTG